MSTVDQSTDNAGSHVRATARHSTALVLRNVSVVVLVNPILDLTDEGLGHVVGEE